MVYDRVNDYHWWEGEEWGKDDMKKVEEKNTGIEEEKIIEEKGMVEGKKEEKKEEKQQELEINILVEGRRKLKRNKK